MELVNTNELDFLTKEVNCDTRRSISLPAKFANLKAIQKVSLMFVLAMLVLVLLSTLLDAINRPVAFLTHFSTISNAKKLFKVDDINRITYIDYAKLLFMMCVLIVHSFVSLESPIGGYMCSGGTHTMGMMNTLWSQPFVNLECLGLMHFIRYTLPSLVK